MAVKYAAKMVLGTELRTNRLTTQPADLLARHLETGECGIGVHFIRDQGEVIVEIELAGADIVYPTDPYRVGIERGIFSTPPELLIEIIARGMEQGEVQLDNQSVRRLLAAIATAIPAQ